MIVEDQHEELYMCKVDFECELGLAAGGNMVYSSVEDLKECRPCVKECGIVKVRVELVDVVQEEDFSRYDPTI